MIGVGLRLAQLAVRRLFGGGAPPVVNDTFDRIASTFSFDSTSFPSFDKAS